MKTPRFGLGFRTPHAGHTLAAPRRVDWLEVVSDHYLGAGGPRRALLERLRSEYPIALHGVGLGIAGSDPLDESYLASLAELIAHCDPAHVSDHLCWTGFGGNQSHDLLPVAYTGEVLRHVAERVRQVQDRIGRALLLENATAYVNFRASEMDEAEFLAELCRATGCGVLLDVNNLYVNAMNLGADPQRALALLPERAVGYLHLAGHAVLPDVRIDTHAESVPGVVWELFSATVRRFPHADVILERDDDLPAYDALVAEVDLARAHHAAALAIPSGRAVSSCVSLRTQPGRTDWRSLQRVFWQHVVAPHEQSGTAALGEILDERLPVRVGRGMRVYSDGYRASLREALATNFPSLVRTLAERDWADLCDAYFAAHPPRGHGFTGIGAALADFVRDYRFAEEYGVDPIVFAQMARLEQAQLEAQDAPDPGHTVTPAQLTAVDPGAWEHAMVSFAPCVRVLRASHDVAPTVRAAARGEAALARPFAREAVYLVARSGDEVETTTLSGAEGSLAESLSVGHAFGSACEASRQATALDERTAVERGARWLLNAAARGWLLAIEDSRGGHERSTNGYAADAAGDDGDRTRELHHQSSSRS